MNSIAKLEPVPLRQLWAHEERGFSAWLENNLDRLADVVGFPLLNPVREKEVGRFSLDLLVETEGGVQVIIENQLAITNHDHLGKVLTYLSNLEAKIAIWVAGEVREEHAEAVRWLNEFTPADVAFYLVKLSAYRIGDSPPAPHFAVVAGPSAEARVIGTEKKDLAQRQVLLLKFWGQLLERARQRGVPYHAQRSPGRDSWLSAGAGVRSGVSYNYNVWTDSTAAELWIQSEDTTENKRIFDHLYTQRAAIENAFGGALTWDRLDDKRASRVRAEVTVGGLYDAEVHWPKIQDAMIDAMDRLVKALKPHYAGL